MERHQQAHRELYECTLCPYTTKLQDDFKAHKREHTVKGLSCDKCDFTTLRPDVLDNHKLSHSDTKLFNCDLCEYATNYAAHIRRHTAKHERDKLKPEMQPKPVKEKRKKVAVSAEKQREVKMLMEKIKAIDNLLNDE